MKVVLWSKHWALSIVNLSMPMNSSVDAPLGADTYGAHRTACSVALQWGVPSCYPVAIFHSVKGMQLLYPVCATVAAWSWSMNASGVWGTQLSCASQHLLTGRFVQGCPGGSLRLIALQSLEAQGPVLTQALSDTHRQCTGGCLSPQLQCHLATPLRNKCNCLPSERRMVRPQSSYAQVAPCLSSMQAACKSSQAEISRAAAMMSLISHSCQNQRHGLAGLAFKEIALCQAVPRSW